MRRQDFQVRLYTFELITKDANVEFSKGAWDRARHRYEEALGAFRYFEATDPSWQSKGIDDAHLNEVDHIGEDEE